MVIEEDWLIRIFQHENLEDLYMTIVDRAETCFKLLYADAIGKAADGTDKTFHVFMKYHMSLVNIVDNPTDPRPKEYFTSERYWYEVIYPTFVQFQREHNIGSPFDNVPKCYGIIDDEISQVLFQRVIVLENLKSTGHVVWHNRQPLPRRHLELVIEAYAKLHATSAAMQKLHPQKFDDIIQAVRGFEKKRNLSLKEEEKYAHFQPSLIRLFTFIDMNRDPPPTSPGSTMTPQQRDDAFLTQSAAVWTERSRGPCMRVIIHGDCWTSNFMSKFEDAEGKVAKDLMIVDWQLIKYGSLICDVSCFLFAFISEADIQHLEGILQFYYHHFVTHLEKFGVRNIDEFYSYDEFKREWKKFCKYGFIATFHAMVAAGDGKGAAATNDVFLDVAILTQRMKHVVQYLKTHDLMQL